MELHHRTHVTKNGSYFCSGPNLHDCYVEAYREEVKKRRRIGAWSGLAGCALLVMFLNSPAIVN